MKDEAAGAMRKFTAGSVRAFPFILHPSAFILCGLLAACLTFAGCANYRAGASTLYAPDIATVYVPMFESTSFRRGLGERLTEAVIKEIEQRTPFKVVNSPDADSVLTGELFQDTKRLLVEAPTDEGREIEVTLRVRVTWANRRTGVVLNDCDLPAPALAEVGFGASYLPEIGQSVGTAQDEAIRNIAAQIVNMMEQPW